MATASTRVPAALQEKFAAITLLTDAFCDQRLNDEYQQMIRLAAAALCRKRPSPVLKGTEAAWAAALVHAVGTVNFLFDASQTPHCKAADIQAHFGVSASNGAKRAREVREALNMMEFSPEWTVASMMDQNPMVWMLEVNGMTVDARRLPLNVQEIAFARGLIPYVPGKKDGG